MSETEQTEKAALEGVANTPCGEVAASCICTKVAGHVAAGDATHHCTQDSCGGKWSGNYADGVGFAVVALPRGGRI